VKQEVERCRTGAMAIGCGFGRRQETVQSSSRGGGGLEEWMRRAGREGFLQIETIGTIGTMGMRQNGDAVATCMRCLCAALLHRCIAAQLRGAAGSEIRLAASFREVGKPAMVVSC
jgi:hypothetical protein